MLRSVVQNAVRQLDENGRLLLCVYAVTPLAMNRVVYQLMTQSIPVLTVCLLCAGFLSVSRDPYSEDPI